MVVGGTAHIKFNIQKFSFSTCMYVFKMNTLKHQSKRKFYLLLINFYYSPFKWPSDQILHAHT